MTAEFKEPPTSLRASKTSRWRAIVDELRAHPNEWALVAHGSPAIGSQIKAGKYSAFIDKADRRSVEVQMRMDWEVTTRRTPDRKHADIYVRYIGG